MVTLIPEAPSNVRVELHDGTLVPLEVAYRGIDEDGVHQWVATVTLRELPKALLVETLPPHTTVMVEGSYE